MANNKKATVNAKNGKGQNEVKSKLRKELEKHLTAVAKTVPAFSDPKIESDIKKRYKGGLAAGNAVITAIGELQKTSASLSDEDFQRSLLDKIARLPELVWETMVEKTQDWSNAIFVAEKKKKEAAGTVAENKKVDAAKKKAGDKVAAAVKNKMHYRIAAKGTWPRIIYDTVAARGKVGMTSDEIVAAIGKMKKLPTTRDVKTAVAGRVRSFSREEKDFSDYAGNGIIFNQNGKIFARSLKQCIALRKEEAKRFGLPLEKAVYDPDEGKVPNKKK